MRKRIPRFLAASRRKAAPIPTAPATDVAAPVEPPPLDKRPQATSYRVEDLLDLVREGRIRVPPFQREWQWGPEDVADLFDSLYRGYPVGTLLLWKRRSEEATLKIGPHTFAVPARDDALWVVDGQQRITALASVLIASTARAPEFDLYFNLAHPSFTRPTHRRPPVKDWLPLQVIVDAEDLFAWLDEYRRYEPPKDRIQLAIRLGKLVREYEIPADVVDTNDENVLRHMFHRVNTAGRPLRETDVFDALHGGGHTQPGEIREVAKRLRDTEFGDFDKDVLLKSLRSLLGQDIVADYNQLLPEGTDPGETLARTERALRRVITFFRDDARIPHLRLVPYTMTVVTLAVFFDLHPEPSARSRQLLARWVWRGAITGAHAGDTMTLRSTLAAIREQKESVAVRALLDALPKPPSSALGLRRFNARTARSKLETLALLGLEPRNLLTGRPVTVPEMFNEAQSASLPMLVSVPTDENVAHTIANRILQPRLPAPRLRELLLGEIPDDVLRSHGIPRAALRKLRKGDPAGFVRDRGERLAVHIAEFLEARAAWSQSDRPALSSMLVADD